MPGCRALWTILWAFCALSLGAPAEAVRIHITGKTSIHARVVKTLAGYEVRGALTDDAGSPVAEQVVYVSLTQGSRKLPFSRLPRACDPTPHVTRGRVAEEAGVDSDAEGKFCVRFDVALPGATISVSFAGNGDHEAAAAEIPFDPSKRGLSLEFIPPPRDLSLDRPMQDVGVETRLETRNLGEPAERLALQLVDERGTELDRVEVEAGERAQFQFPSELLAPPGAGKLIVRFGGKPGVAAAEATAVVQRSVLVRLTQAKPPAPGDPSQGVDIHVAVSSSLGAAESGSVEALVGGESVGAAPVSAGAAKVVAVFDAAHSTRVPVMLRYLPAAPWFRPAEPITVSLPVTGPSAWRLLPWALAALGVAFWVMRAWQRPARAERPKREEQKQPTGRPSIELVEPGPSAGGWRGEVVDAHDGIPVAGARVEILSPSFQGDGVLRSTRTDENGQFELRQAKRPEGARISVRSPWHTSIERPVPAPGHLTIAIVGRRRALIDRLVSWASGRGKPWTRPGEPTPGHVAAAAEQRSQRGVARWARAVERAAYGPEGVDEAVEAEVRDLEPSGDSSSDPLTPRTRSL